MGLHLRTLLALSPIATGTLVACGMQWMQWQNTHSNVTYIIPAIKGLEDKALCDQVYFGENEEYNGVSGF